MPADLTLSLTIPSTLYFGGDMTVIPGGYSLPMTISARNDNNRKLLGYPDFLNIKTFIRTHEVKLYLDGNYYDTGTLYVKMANPDEYQVQVFFNAGRLSALKGKTLKDYDYGPTVWVDTNLAGWNDFVESLCYPANFEHLFFPVNYMEDDDIPGSNDYRLLGGTFAGHLLKTIFEQEGYSFNDEVFDINEPRRLFICGDKLTGVVSSSPTQTEVNYLDFVPHLPVETFLKNIPKLMCVAYMVDTRQRRVTVFSMAGVLSADYVDLTERLRSELEINYEFEVKIKRFAFAENNRLTTFPAQQLQISEGDEITSALTTLTDHYTFPLNGNQKAVEIPGTFNESTPGAWSYEELELKDGAFMLYFRGTYADTNGNQYPFCSHDIYDPSGWVVGETRLLFDGTDYGLYDATEWKTWLDFLSNTVEVSADFLLRWEDIYNSYTLFRRRIRLWDEHGGGWQHFLLKQMKIVIHNTRGIQIAQQTLVQIKP